MEERRIEVAEKDCFIVKYSDIDIKIVYYNFQCYFNYKDVVKLFKKYVGIYGFNEVEDFERFNAPLAMFTAFTEKGLEKYADRINTLDSAWILRDFTKHIYNLMYAGFFDNQERD